MIRTTNRYYSSIAIKKFPKPLVVSLDAFGTLYVPKAPIPIQYSNIASKYGITMSPQTIERRFGPIFKTLAEKYPNYGKLSNWTADRWWSELIIRLFELNPVDPKTSSLCKDLLNHFTDEKAYSVYEDVIPLLSQLRDEKITLIISSNSDSRINLILESLKLSQFFHEDLIFLSYDLDTTKPEKEFFDKIVGRLVDKFPHLSELSDSELRSRIWHIGDEEKKDLLGCIASGWKGILIDRENSYEYLTKNGQNVSPETKDEIAIRESKNALTHANSDIENIRILAENKIITSNLTNLLDLY